MCRKMLCTVYISFLLGLWIVPAQADLQEGLVAYFKLDETSGTFALDASGNENNGTLIGPQLEWVPGYDGGSLGFAPPATGDVANRLEFPTTGMSFTAGTVCVWVYLTDPQPASSGRYLFGHTSQPQFSNRIQLYMQDGTNVSRKLDIGLGGAHTTKADMIDLPMRDWLHVAMTWNDGAYAVYVDGAKVADGTYSGLTGLHTIANFGNDGSNAPYESFSGMLDEARVYNRALTPAEVKQVFDLPAVPRIKAWGPSPADGTKDVEFGLFRWKSLDAIKLHDVYMGTDPNLTAANRVATRSMGNLYFHMGVLEPGVQYYWRADGIDPDNVTVHPGDVWTFVVKASTAYYPTPADGANTVFLSPDLVWLPGTAALTHHVYLGDDPNAVAQGAADADKGIVADPNFAPGDLDPATTYFWRVDEVLPGDVVKTGPVWSFTTVVPIDDFESYTDVDDGTRIFDAWLDGYATQSNGSTVGHLDAPFAEQTIVHGGLQSMPLDYNNVNTPFYSEAELTFTAAEDWTADGVDTLVLYIRGRVSNKAAPVYVTLKDSTNRSATVVHPDAKVVNSMDWAEWKIPLSDFAGVNLARVKTMYLGVGDRANPVAGATGMLYIDDIGLCKPSPAK